MREYPTTTNTDLVLALPALTVTVRTAFYNPPEVLPPRDIDEGKGREAWKNGVAVKPYFKLSGRIEPGKPVKLSDVVDLDGKKIRAERRSRKTGVAHTDVPSAYTLSAREVGEAKIPLLGLEKGVYLLAIVPAEKEVTKPEGPAGPKTMIEPGVERSYRPLYVQLTLDEDLRLVDASVVLYVSEAVFDNPPVHDADTKKLAGWLVNHGYVTAFSHGELAIEWKPDFLRTVRTLDVQKAATESGTFKRYVDMVVVHGTGGPLIGPAVNTATGPLTSTGHPYGPHYELDLDGHNVKFAYDDAIVSHAGYSRFYDVSKRQDIHNIASLSIGIEVVNQAQGTRTAQSPFPEPQMRALVTLLGSLKAAHPKVLRHRIMGHLDIATDEAYTKLANRRITCPGRNMQWPRLEANGFGIECVTRALTKADYSGFFTLSLGDFPAKFPGKPRGTELFLRAGDSDGEEKWGGVKWTTREAKELLAAKGLVFKGLVREMQTDLQTLGYFVTVNGVFDTKTNAALEHCIHHIFSGSRKGLVPGGNGLYPKVLLNPTVAGYLKGSVGVLLAGLAAAGGATGAAGGAGAGGGGAPDAGEHAQIDAETWGDLHDREEEGEAKEEGVG